MSDEHGAGRETSDDQRTVNDAWDRFGTFMQTAQSTWDRLARRNFDFWKDVSGSLKSGPVDADKLAANSARAMAVAQETLQDLWLTLVEPPQREVFVQVLPTAFLFFDKITDAGDEDPGDEPRYAGQDPVHIPVNHERQGELPDAAQITLSGNPSDPAMPAALAIRALTDRLRVVKQPGSRSYLLQTIDTGVAGGLVAGTYDGLIYLTNPTLPLANLRIVVEGPPPVVDPKT